MARMQLDELREGLELRLVSECQSPCRSMTSIANIISAAEQFKAYTIKNGADDLMLPSTVLAASTVGEQGDLPSHLHSMFEYQNWPHVCENRARNESMMFSCFHSDETDSL